MFDRSLHARVMWLRHSQSPEGIALSLPFAIDESDVLAWFSYFVTPSGAVAVTSVVSIVAYGENGIRRERVSLRVPVKMPSPVGDPLSCDEYERFVFDTRRHPGYAECRSQILRTRPQCGIAAYDEVREFLLLEG